MDMKMKWVGITFISLIVFWALLSSPQGAEPLPDTGQTKFYNNSGEISEPAPGGAFYGQDAHYTWVRSYTKLASDGSDLVDTARIWYMVRDNVTGLIWEVKQNNDGTKHYDNPHDADNTYTWYDSNPATNGGNAGASGTDTEDFINVMNAGSGFCDYTDWRLPTIKELSRLIDSGCDRGAVITVYFFHQTSPSDYWSSTTNTLFTDHAWYVNFKNGLVDENNKTKSYYVRAVRSGS